MFRKFFEAQQSSETLKLICAEVVKVRTDFDSFNEKDKERQLFEKLDLQNQIDIIKQLDLNRVNTIEYQYKLHQKIFSDFTDIQNS